MGGTAIKGKQEIVLKIKNTNIKSSQNLKNSNTSNKTLPQFLDKKFSSTGAVSSFQNAIHKSNDKIIINDNSNSTRSLKKIDETEEIIQRNSRNLGKKIRPMMIKSKSQIDASTEIDVLKIIKNNNYYYEDYDLIDNCLLKHFFMRCLDQEARNEIIKEMSLCKIDAETYIFRQDSMGSFFYIIKKGDCELFVNDNYLKDIKAGESFGELALLHGAPRSGSVKTKEVTYVWCLERNNFRKIVDHINKINYEENKRFINSIPILNNIENDLKSILASNLIKEYYDKDKTIVKGKKYF